MTDQLHINATLKALRFKSGTQADPDPSAELVLRTDELRSATDFAFLVGKELTIEASPWQQSLPTPSSQVEGTVTDAELPFDQPTANGTEHAGDEPKEFGPRAGRKRGTTATIEE